MLPAVKLFVLKEEFQFTNKLELYWLPIIQCIRTLQNRFQTFPIASLKLNAHWKNVFHESTLPPMETKWSLSMPLA